MNRSIIATATLSLSAMGAAVAAERPNVILIMCDDMGYSDLGCYGSEIKTPNIDMLAEQGVRFTQFKNTGRSCPSRAALLTGRYQHTVGMGWMTTVDEQREGYHGQMTGEVPTIAEVFKSAGYGTYMSGKWHVTLDEAYNDRSKPVVPNGSFPTERGFDRYFGALTGGGGFYKPYPLMQDDKQIKKYPNGFYYTTAITENAVQYINEHNSENPMFLYVAHYAPHRPLQAPQDRIDATIDRYTVGYDVLRERRFAKQKELGLVSSSAELPIHSGEYKNGVRPSWDSLTPEQQQNWIKEGATFAAMVEMVDDGIGELIEATKRKGIYDNTIFIFLSDNGATSEGGLISQLCADLNNTPYRSYKRWTFMGGVSSPLVIHYPKEFGKQSGKIRTTPAHIIDLMPTALSLAGIEYPTSFAGKDISPMSGVDISPLVEGRKIAKRDIFFEHQTSCAIITSDGWKLVRESLSNSWELFNLNEDPFEENNIAAIDTKRAEELEARWTAWAESNKVFPLETRPWTQRIKYYKSLPRK